MGQRELVGLLTGNKKGGLERYFEPKNLQPFVPEKFKNKKLDQVTHRFIFGEKRHMVIKLKMSLIFVICVKDDS